MEQKVVMVPGSMANCRPPQQGAWSAWSAWSECDHTCEETRERLCDNPEAVGAGNECPGEGQETRACCVVEGIKEETPLSREKPHSSTAQVWGSIRPQNPV